MFNLFVVSVFLSFMVDLFSSPQGKRLFGLIAAGGTAGAISGPTLTALLVGPLGPINLLLLSALLLAGAVLCIQQLGQWSAQPPAVQLQAEQAPLGGSILAGLSLIVGANDAPHIRYLGITHYTESAYDDLARVMESEDIDFVQLNYSILSRSAEQRLLPLALDKKIAVLVNRPFERSGLFDQVRAKTLPPWAKDIDCTSWAQFFLKFILSHPAVTCAIPATSKPKHLLDNMQAGLGRLPDAALRERMALWVREL